MASRAFIVLRDGHAVLHVLKQNDLDQQKKRTRYLGVQLYRNRVVELIIETSRPIILFHTAPFLAIATDGSKYKQAGKLGRLSIFSLFKF